MTAKKECKLSKNGLGLYDLRISDGGFTVVEVQNITLPRAVGLIEEHMYTTGRADDARDAD